MNSNDPPQGDMCALPVQNDTIQQKEWDFNSLSGVHFLIQMLNNNIDAGNNIINSDFGTERK